MLDFHSIFVNVELLQVLSDLRLGQPPLERLNVRPPAIDLGEGSQNNLQLPKVDVAVLVPIDASYYQSGKAQHSFLTFLVFLNMLKKVAPAAGFKKNGKRFEIILSQTIPLDALKTRINIFKIENGVFVTRRCLYCNFLLTILKRQSFAEKKCWDAKKIDLNANREKMTEMETDCSRIQACAPVVRHRESVCPYSIYFFFL